MLKVILYSNLSILYQTKTWADLEQSYQAAGNCSAGNGANGKIAGWGGRRYRKGVLYNDAIQY